MCGIAGILRTNQLPLEGEIRLMIDSVAHRGPDGEGIFIKENLALGHRRLSIIDLELGTQPMSNSEKNIWITYNGEIYNFRELRKELEKNGYIFKTNSDTEVIIYSYEYWGVHCVEKFRGMFAFCIADFKKQLLFLARDHFGIKPLVYRKGKNYFAFASELQALIIINDDAPKGSFQSLDYFLRYQYIPAPDTIYKGIFKLEPACYLIIGFDGQEKIKKTYWNINFDKTVSFSEDKWIAKANEAIKESVIAHMISDVPFGVFLSGGVDSAIIASKMQDVLQRKIKAFTIGFDETEYNEIKYAEIAAKNLGLELITEIVSLDKFSELPDIINLHCGEPFGDDSIIPTWALSKLARTEVPLVLSGDGGDEVFGGYYSYYRWMENHPIKLLKRQFNERNYFNIPRFLIGTLRRYIGNSSNFFDVWQDEITQITKNDRLKLWKKEFHNLIYIYPHIINAHHKFSKDFDRLSYAQYMDFQTYLPNSILAKVDIASMSHGLEVRPPLLDIKIAELLYNLPRSMKYKMINKKFEGKYILKKILSQDFSNDFVYRRKQGFATPKVQWLKSGQLGNKLFKDIVLENSSQLKNIFNMEALSYLYYSHGDKQDNSKILWLFLILGIWFNGNKDVTFE